MNSKNKINICKKLTDKYGFEHTHIEKYFKKEEIEKNYNRLIRIYSSQTKNWSDQLNSEWTVRFYLAIKMILSSSVLLSSLEYVIEKNLRIVEPYLIYYSLLNVCRAIIFTLPYKNWDNGEILTLRHSQIINIVSDAVAAINRKAGDNLKKLLIKSKHYRELFSYKFPANGIKGLSNDIVVDIGECIEFCSLLSEIAQFNSEILQQSFDKNVKKEYDFVENILSKGFEHDFEDGDTIFDQEDYYRIGFIIRKVKRPYNLQWMMTEGMVEDFFGAWCSENDENNDVFDPDVNWQIIFPVP